MAVFVNSASTGGDPSGGFSVAAPSGITGTDLLLAIHFGSYTNSAAAMTAPAGFTQVGSTFQDPNNSIIKIWTAPASTSAPYAFGGSGHGQVGVLDLASPDPTTPINVMPVFNAGETIDVQMAPSVMPDVSNGTLICGWCCMQSTTTMGYTSDTMTVSVSGSYNTNGSPFIAAITNHNLGANTASRTTGTRAAQTLIAYSAISRYASVSLVVV